MIVYRTGNLPKPFPRYAKKLRLVEHARSNEYSLYHYDTRICDLFRLNSGDYILELKDGNYRSATTKKHINSFFQYLGLDIHLYQQRYQWYLRLMNDSVIPYYNNILINIDKEDFTILKNYSLSNI